MFNCSHVSQNETCCTAHALQYNGRQGRKKWEEVPEPGLVIGAGPPQIDKRIELELVIVRNLVWFQNSIKYLVLFRLSILATYAYSTVHSVLYREEYSVRKGHIFLAARFDKVADDEIPTSEWR